MELIVKLDLQGIDLIVNALKVHRDTQFPILPTYEAGWRATLVNMKSDLETEQLKYDKGSYEYYQLEKEIVHIAGVLKAS